MTNPGDDINYARTTGEREFPFYSRLSFGPQMSTPCSRVINVNAHPSQSAFQNASHRFRGQLRNRFFSE